jgi:hypothetical protein
MAYLLNRIEHRWGRRFRVNIPVRAAVSSSEVECRLRNFISLPLLAEGRALVKAHVTRKLNEGVAIEWCEFAPYAVKELLRSPEVADVR